MSNFKLGYLPMTADLLHIGHIRAIEQCKEKCDVLFIGLLTDTAVKRYRGEKPVIPFEERRELLEALNMKNVWIETQRSIDMTTNLKKFSINVAFSGDGWEEEEIEAMEKCQVVTGTFDYCKKQSTTKIKNKIKTL